MAETMGQRLQSVRQDKGMSQPELAKAAGVPVGTLRNWEQDRRAPRLDTAKKVARALGVSVDALTVNGGEEKPSAPPGVPPAGDLEAAKQERKAKSPANRDKPPDAPAAKRPGKGT